jgi:hypothetical protein
MALSKAVVLSRFAPVHGPAHILIASMPARSRRVQAQSAAAGRCSTGGSLLNFRVVTQPADRYSNGGFLLKRRVATQPSDRSSTGGSFLKRRVVTQTGSERFQRPDANTFAVHLSHNTLLVRLHHRGTGKIMGMMIERFLTDGP